MTIAAESIEQARRILARTTAFYEIHTDKSSDAIIECATSASMPFIRVSKRGSQMILDRRFFTFLRHALIGIELFDQPFLLPTGVTKGSIHLDAVVWTILAERVLNPGEPDVPLAVGILGQESVYFQGSLTTLGAHASQLNPASFSLDPYLLLFEQFVIAHETAHFEIKHGLALDLEMRQTVASALTMADKRCEELKAKGDVHPDILASFQAARDVRASQALFEEVLADMFALHHLSKSPESDPLAAKMPAGMLNTLMTNTTLYGLAALGLMSFTAALSSKDAATFQQRWATTRTLCMARTQVIQNVLRILAIEQPEPAGPQRQFEYINRSSNRLFPVLRTVEKVWEQRFRSGEIARFEAGGNSSTVGVCVHTTRTSVCHCQEIGVEVATASHSPQLSGWVHG